MRTARAIDIDSYEVALQSSGFSTHRWNLGEKEVLEAIDNHAPPVNIAVALLETYQRPQEISEQMWKQWIKEYVPSVNQHTKWLGETANLKKGDLVYLVEGDTRKSWVRGIVEEPIVAEDGRVR